MKKFFIVAAALVLSASAAMAQDYLRLQASFVSNKMTNIDDPFEIKPGGVNFGGVAGFLVSDNLPIYLEPGLNISWSHSAKDFNDGAQEIKFTYMSAAIPLNGVYKYDLNDKVAVSGFFGFNFKANFMAKEHDKGFVNPIVGKKNYSWLSKKDMGDRDNRASIFQFGSQVGAGFHVSRFYIGYQFQWDWMKFQEFDIVGYDSDAHKWVSNYITVGYTL